MNTKHGLSARSRTIALGSVAALAAVALALGGSGAAIASASTEATAERVDDFTEVSTGASGAVVTASVGGAVEAEMAFELPGEVATDTVELTEVPAELRTGDGVPLATASLDGAVLTSYGSELGVQTLIEIEGPGAPTEYSFPFELPEGLRLELQPDGSVFVEDPAGTPTAMIDVPWALDAHGDAVPTFFRVDGDSLTQVIDTTAVSAYPVIADPDLWFIVANSAGCLAEIAGLSLVGAKAVQVFAKADKIIRAATALGKYYDALGGKVDKVLGIFKKWINNRNSLTRAQLSALEGLMREGAKIFFNALGLGSCFALVRGY